MGFGIKDLKKATSDLGRGTIQVAQAPLYPVAYLGGLQQGGWEGGNRATSDMASSPEDFWKSPQNRSMMALTVAEIAAIALTAGAAGPGIPGAAVGLPAGVTFAPTAGGYALAAGAVGASAYGINSIGGGSAGVDGAPPPDINEANDPATAAQFQRIRRAARMLGRAGTIKNKSTASSLGGDGTQTLGTQLSVTGA
jgi:hypothetical protein